MANIAMPVGEGFEDTEFSQPYERLAGCRARGRDGRRRARRARLGKNGQAMATIEHIPDDLDPSSIDALVIPGGHSPDQLRTNQSHRVVRAAVCRDQQAGRRDLPRTPASDRGRLVEGREVTSWSSVRKDLENAGARWIDRAVVEDGNLITSRGPDDLDEFCDAILGRLPPTIGRRTRRR